MHTSPQGAQFKDANITITPVKTGGHAVRIKVGDEDEVSQFCKTKSNIIQFMQKVL